MGIQDFKEIREADYLYIDKSEMISQILSEGAKVYLYTRPRRFGKSVNLSMLDAFFNSAIEPFAIALSEALSRAIYTDRERSYGNHVYVNANRLQYMSQTAKVTVAKELGDRGILTINEIRELFNYAPLPDGNVAFIRGEYKPVDEKVEENDNERSDEEEN